MSATREIIREHSHPPQLPSLHWTERVALHLGVALIRWADHTDRSQLARSSEQLDSVATRRELVAAHRQAGLIG